MLCTLGDKHKLNKTKCYIKESYIKWGMEGTA
jgi:hypothetical protein